MPRRDQNISDISATLAFLLAAVATYDCCGADDSQIPDKQFT